MLVPYDVSRIPEALNFDKAKTQLDQVAAGNMIAFGMNIHGRERLDVLNEFSPQLNDLGFEFQLDNSTGFQSGPLDDEMLTTLRRDHSARRLFGLINWHVDYLPNLSGPVVKTINFHFSDVGFGRAQIAQIRSDRLSQYDNETNFRTREELNRGLVNTELLKRNVQIGTIGVGRLLVFRSVGHSPALHSITTTSDQRFSKVHYADFVDD